MTPILRAQLADVFYRDGRAAVADAEALRKEACDVKAMVRGERDTAFLRMAAEHVGFLLAEHGELLKEGSRLTRTAYLLRREALRAGWSGTNPFGRLLTLPKSERGSASRPK